MHTISLKVTVFTFFHICQLKTMSTIMYYCELHFNKQTNKQKMERGFTYHLPNARERWRSFPRVRQSRSWRRWRPPLTSQAVSGRQGSPLYTNFRLRRGSWRRPRPTYSGCRNTYSMSTPDMSLCLKQRIHDNRYPMIPQLSRQLTTHSA